MATIKSSLVAHCLKCTHGRRNDENRVHLGSRILLTSIWVLCSKHVSDCDLAVKKHQTRTTRTGAHDPIRPSRYGGSPYVQEGTKTPVSPFKPLRRERIMLNHTPGRMPSKSRISEYFQLVLARLTSSTVSNPNRSSIHARTPRSQYRITSPYRAGVHRLANFLVPESVHHTRPQNVTPVWRAFLVRSEAS